MQTSMNITSKAVKIQNNSSTLTLKINKAKLSMVLRKALIAVFFGLYGFLVYAAYSLDQIMFNTLLVAGAILLMVLFVAAKSRNV